MKIADLYTFERRPRKQQTGTRKVRGVGVNDADYQTIDNNGNRCPAYIKWKDILSRVYAPSMVVNRPSYNSVKLAEEWVYFSAFREWYMAQTGELQWAVDKDLLATERKIYSPETCILLPRELNNFLTNIDESTTGCTLSHGKFQAQCGNPITGKNDRLGGFTTKEEARAAWLHHKHVIALKLADMYQGRIDERGLEALRTRFKEFI